MARTCARSLASPERVEKQADLWQGTAPGRRQRIEFDWPELPVGQHLMPPFRRGEVRQKRQGSHTFSDQSGHMSVVGDNGARYGDGFACLAPITQNEPGIIECAPSDFLAVDEIQLCADPERDL